MFANSIGTIYYSGREDIEINEKYETFSGMRKGDEKFKGILHQKFSIAVVINSKQHLFLSYIGDGHLMMEKF